MWIITLTMMLIIMLIDSSNADNDSDRIMLSTVLK